MGNWLIILTAVVMLAGVVGWLLHWYVLSAAWWPLAGREWRAWHRLLDLPDPAVRNATSPVGEPNEDDWADQLHVINLAVHRDRPVAQLTHYEVEAVIRQLGVAEWVPERQRTAA